MALDVAGAEATECMVDEEDVGEGIKDLGGITGEIVVLVVKQSVLDLWRLEGGSEVRQLLVSHTSSHQFRVDVTGCQYPVSGTTYGYAGSHCGIMREAARCLP